MTPSGLCSTTATPPSMSSWAKWAWRHQVPVWAGGLLVCALGRGNHRAQMQDPKTPESFPSTSQTPSQGSFYSTAVGASLHWGLAASLWASGGPLTKCSWADLRRTLFDEQKGTLKCWFSICLPLLARGNWTAVVRTYCNSLQITHYRRSLVSSRSLSSVFPLLTGMPCNRNFALLHKELQ